MVFVQLTVADDQVVGASQNGLNKFRDIAAGILVVGIGVDDDICAKGKGELNAVHESPGKATVLAVTDDIFCAMSQGNFRCAIF